MARITVVPVVELCNSHLIVEHRNILGILNAVNSGKAKLTGVYPKKYTLGKGHIVFFYTKLKWLHNRYKEVYEECKARGFNVTWMWPDSVPENLYNDWEVTQEALDISRERIHDRMPVNARFTKRRY